MTIEESQHYEETLHRLLAEIIRINFPYINEPDARALKDCAKLKAYMADGSATLLGAFADGGLIGFAWIYVHANQGEKRLHLNQIVLDAAYRRHNVGSRLMEHVEALAQAWGCSAIDLMVTADNRAAVAMYKGLGYEPERFVMRKGL